MTFGKNRAQILIEFFLALGPLILTLVFFQLAHRAFESVRVDAGNYWEFRKSVVGGDEIKTWR